MVITNSMMTSLETTFSFACQHGLFLTSWEEINVFTASLAMHDRGEAGKLKACMQSVHDEEQLYSSVPPSLMDSRLLIFELY